MGLPTIAIDTTVGFIAAIMFGYVSSRCIVASSILAAILILLATIALPAVLGNLTIIEILSTCIFAAAFIIYGGLVRKAGGRAEYNPRLPSVFLAILTIIIFYIAWYSFKVINIPVEFLTYISIAFALVFATFLFRDTAKMGLSLMIVIWCLHSIIPETYALIGVGLEIFCLVAVGAMVYFTYREYGTRNVDVMVKLRY